jgi:dienelactone hydrolase
VLASVVGDRPAMIDAAAPVNEPGADVAWYQAQAPRGKAVTIGVVRALPGTGPHRPPLVLVPGTEGLSTMYVQFAREAAARGFDVAVACWFRTDPPYGFGHAGIACPNAPDFKGVSDEAVADLDAVVAGARRALGSATPTLVGFSRGGGIVTLRAARGRPEPVVSVAGMVEGYSEWGQLPTEVNIVPIAGRIRTPVLLFHGELDHLVPVSQAQHLEAALRAAGKPVEAHYYPGQDHGIIIVPEIRADIQSVIANWRAPAGALSR